VIVLIVYGWTIIWFFWRLPGWLLFLRAPEVLMAFAYALATNLAESLVVLVPLVLLNFLLPKAWFRDFFVARGSAAAIAALAYIVFLTYQFQYKSEYPSLRLPGWQLIVPSVAIPLLAYAWGKVAVLRKALESLADRATIFLYVTLPASIVAALVVLFRSVV
jgi:hypothetical protein